MLSKYYRIIFVLLVIFLDQLLINAQSDKDSIAYYKEQLKHIDDVSIEEAILYFHQLCQRSSGKEKIKVILRKANFYAKHGIHAKVKETYLEALELAKANKYKLLEASIYNELGYYYYYILNNTTLSFKYFIDAKDIYEELNREEELYIVNTNIACFLSENDEIEQAENLFIKTLNYYTKKGDIKNIVFVKINLGGLYTRSKRFNESKELFIEILKNNELDSEEISLIYYNLAINAIDQNKYTEAKIFIDKAITASTKINDIHQLTDLLFLKADIELGHGNKNKAIDFYKESLKLAKEISDYPFQKTVLESLLLVSNNNKHDNIQTLLNEISIVTDSIKNIEKENTIKEIYLKNSLVSKQREFDIQQETLKKQKELNNTYISIVLLSILLLIASISYIFIYRKNNYKRLLLVKQEVQIKQIENDSKRKIEEIETKRIQNELNAKKRELLIDLSYTEERVEKVRQVLRKMDELAAKSIITKQDVLNLKEFTVLKYEKAKLNEQIKKNISTTNNDFYINILRDYPKLSKTELMVLSLIRLMFDTKEIARIQNVSVDAIRKTRHRIRKKIDLKPDQSIEKYILKYY